MFVSLAGIDGSGKSTVATLAANTLQAARCNVRLLQKRDAQAVAADRFEGIIKRHADALWRDHDDTSGDVGDAYWWLMQMAWYALMTETVIRPCRDAGVLLVADDWTQKIAARYALKPHFDPELLSAGLVAAATPDLVILLDTPPEVAAERKHALGFAETGGSDGHQAGRRSSFVDYQGRVRELLRQQAIARGWDVILTVGRSAEDVAAEVVATIGRCQLLARSPTT